MALVEPHVASLRPYVPGRSARDVQALYGLERVASLASNENPLGPSPRAAAAVRGACPTLHRYPDGGGVALKRALAERHGLDPSGVVLGNGSNELIELAVRTFLRPGERVVVPERSFVVYRMVTQAAGGETLEVPSVDLGDGVEGIDLDAVGDALGPGVRLVFVANPNNPTGAHVTRDAWLRLLERVPPDVVVVMDEAYAEYTTDPDVARGLDGATPERNVIALRTFSKAYGLAALRVGYALTRRPELAACLERVRQPFNVNALAQAAALAALGDDEHLARSRAANAEGLERLRAGLGALGLAPRPSQGNFTCVDLGRDAAGAAEALEARGVLVRPLGGYGLPTSVRITVGTPAEIEMALAALGALLQAPPGGGRPLANGEPPAVE